MAQSTFAADPQIVPVQTLSGSTMLSVALVSLSSLLLELALTRLFSVVLFYHFAFFAISVALLGLGSGGVFAHIRQEWLARFDMRTLGGWLCLLNSIFILCSVEVVLHTPVSLEVTGRNFGKLTIIYLAAAVPFFLTGLLFSVLFARSSGHISQLTRWLRSLFCLWLPTILARSLMSSTPRACIAIPNGLSILAGTPSLAL